LVFLKVGIGIGVSILKYRDIGIGIFFGIFSRPLLFSRLCSFSIMPSKQSATPVLL